MAKRIKNKREKQPPNIVLFLVEGTSDQIALEEGLFNLIHAKCPDFHVEFLQQQKVVNKNGTEIEDSEDEEDLIPEEEYEMGGDITSSAFVDPTNIELKIYNRFIKPVSKSMGIYPRHIAKIIQIVDLDGAFIPNENVVQYLPEEEQRDRLFYDSDNGVIKTHDIDKTIERNLQKQSNLEYLLSLQDGMIKIKTRSVPYEIYYFSSNIDHFIGGDANLEYGKKKLAHSFMRKYGLYPEKFCDFFLNDENSYGGLGYQESWKRVKENTNSIIRGTNIDCLIRSLLSENEPYNWIAETGNKSTIYEK